MPTSRSNSELPGDPEKKRIVELRNNVRNRIDLFLKSWVDAEIEVMRKDKVLPEEGKENFYDLVFTKYALTISFLCQAGRWLSWRSDGGGEEIEVFESTVKSLPDYLNPYLADEGVSGLLSRVQQEFQCPSDLLNKVVARWLFSTYSECEKTRKLVTFRKRLEAKMAHKKKRKKKKKKFGKKKKK